ncbi:helix-turn-helix transcriptional regulator [Hydrogenophaga taeniospiralis]|uniref:helix-turn-helix domain-containing protein n=1 Tax=Hydrogenophaga taeniospiralis TaxID=65656 RepID=UPI001CFA2A82|nr:helix-turn-helix domain-containing protein [Hydrogenophaga taeniospiralis]MCB4362666.1 helix-turn-helix transcriptional regulator [Hydrogenophaga taeniospiralis]
MFQKLRQKPSEMPMQLCSFWWWIQFVLRVVDVLHSVLIDSYCGAVFSTRQYSRAVLSANIFERLRAERERLGRTQEEFAAIAGVTRRPYVEWEKGGGPSPNAVQLSALAAAGADVLYILMGQRAQGLPEADLLPADERVLIDSYRRCNAEARRNLIQTAALLSAGMPAARTQKPSGGQSQSAVGNNNIQIGRVGNKARIKNK